MSKALRRHHNKRLKSKRANYYCMNLTNNPKALGKVLHTPACCSCVTCGNSRKHFNRPTLAEQASEQSFKEEVSCLRQEN